MTRSQDNCDHKEMAALVAFAKNPTLVTVKTRLARSIGQQAAEAVYLAMLDDCLNQLGCIAGATTYLACYPDENHTLFQNLASKYGVTLLSQHGGNLGERMLNCVQVLLPKHNSVIIFGTDVPILPVTSIKNALSSLQIWDILLGPGPDGGYWAFGAQRLEAGIFNDIEWSTSGVLNSTIENCQRLNLRVSLLDTAIDVDNIEGLKEVAHQLPLHMDAGKCTRETLQHLDLPKLQSESTRLDYTHAGSSQKTHVGDEIISDKEFVDVVLQYGKVLSLPTEQPSSVVVTNLSGNINRVRRVALEYADGQKLSFILKHVPAGGRLERYPSVIFPENRLEFEAAWFHHSKEAESGAEVRTPLVYEYCKEKRLIIMEDLQPNTSLSNVLMRDTNIVDLVEKLGRYLGMVHASSLGMGIVNNPAAAINRLFVYKIALIEPETIRSIWRSKAESTSTGRGHAFSQDDFDTLINIQDQFLQQHAATLLPVLEDMEKGFKLDPRLVFTHGDLHADSVLILANSQVGVVDAELSDTGNAAFDLGMLSAHIWAAQTVNGASKNHIVDLIRLLFSAYLIGCYQQGEIVEDADILWRDTLRHCGAELLRRLIGAAGFPFRITAYEIEHLLDESRCLLLAPENITLSGRLQ